MKTVCNNNKNKNEIQHLLHSVCKINFIQVRCKKGMSARNQTMTFVEEIRFSGIKDIMCCLQSRQILFIGKENSNTVDMQLKFYKH